MIDVHAHMYDEDFANDLDKVLERAVEAKITQIIVVSEDLDTAHTVLKMCSNNSLLRPAIGLHPCSVNPELVDEQVEQIIDLIDKHSTTISCIGEVGLDFSPNIIKDTLKEMNLENYTQDQVKHAQRKALTAFAQASIKHDLALNVHSRSAGRPTIQLLKECGAKKVLLHCFDGSIKVAKQGVECGYYFSVPANVVRSEQMQELVKALPMSNLMLETDSPALQPVIDTTLSKQARNEPANIKLSVDKIAQIKGISAEEVIKITSENAHKLFRLNL
jgi:TatD DNase family protein